jgi:hypothetical protein
LRIVHAAASRQRKQLSVGSKLAKWMQGSEAEELRRRITAPGLEKFGVMWYSLHKLQP